MSFLNWHFAAPAYVNLVWLALAIAFGLAIAEYRSRDALDSFLSRRMQARLTTRPSTWRVGTKLGLFLLGLGFGVLALMRPQARGVTETVSSARATADVVFVLDVSKSMLADDVAPTRLSRAKAEIGQIAEKLSQHRMGLVVFAGRAVPVCPLTPDHSFFNLVLSGIDTKSVSTGGTRIGEAVNVAVRSFPTGPGAKLIVLITDGEDHESYPLEAAKAARDAGVKIVAVGLGSEEGSQIQLVDPTTGAKTTLLHDGQPVVSKLDGETLRQMALTTEGAYVPAGTAALDLDSIVESHVKPIVRAGADAALRVIPAERYAWFVLLSMLSLFAAAWVGAGSFEERRMTRMLALLVLTLGACTAGETRPARERYNEGVGDVAAANFDGAEKAFLAARDQAGVDPELRYRAAFNLGTTYATHAASVKAGEKPDLEQAMTLLQSSAAWFRDALRQRKDDADAKANLDIVLVRIQALGDELRKGENGLEPRLDALIEAQRTLRDEVRAIDEKLAAAAAGGDPLAMQDELTQLANRERVILADAGVVGDLAADEIDAIGKKPEAERKDEEKVRVVQLQNLDLYLQESRTALGDARRKLQDRLPKASLDRASDALEMLKRAREQLLDPITVLKGVAGDQVSLGEETMYLAAANGALTLTDAPPTKDMPVPPWLTADSLGARQGAIRDRVEEVRARLEAGLAAQTEPDPVASPTDPSAPPTPAEDPAKAAEKAKLMALVAKAVPHVQSAAAAMVTAQSSLTGNRLDASVEQERTALVELARAIEQFSDLRQTIDLAYGEQQQIGALLVPAKDAGAKLDPRQRARDVGDGIGRNLDRLARLQGLVADEQEKQLAQAAAAQQQGAAQGSGAAPPPDAAAQQSEQIKAMFSQAESLRGQALAAVNELGAALAKPGTDPVPPQTRAQTNLAELQKLFFSVIEHLQQLLRDQSETRDQTARAAGEDDIGRAPLLPGLVTRETGHTGMGQAIADALAKQADAGSQGGDPKQAEQAKNLGAAAEEVRLGVGEMQGAQTGLEGAANPSAAVSVDLQPTLDGQAKAIEHLENALRLLQPPPKDQDNKDKQDQKDQKDQKDQQDPKDGKGDKDKPQDPKDGKGGAPKPDDQKDPSGALQRVRDDEAKRQREKKERERSQPESVDKDW